jgi:hypothetical protein
MGFFSSLNPVKAVKNVANVFKPGGSVLGKIYDAASASPGGPILNAGLKSSAQLVRGTSGFVGKNVGGAVGKFGRHWQNMADKDVNDQRRTFINAGKVAGSIVGGGMLAPAAGAAAGGGLAGGAAAGATAGAVGGAVQGRGLEGIAQGAALGGITGGAASAMGPVQGFGGAVGQGAARGGLSAALQGNSIGDGALVGGTSAGVSDAAGGGFMGNLAGRYAGSELAQGLTDNQAVQPNQGAPMNMNGGDFNPNGYTGPTPGMGNSLAPGESGGQPMPNPQAPQGMDPWSAGITGLSALWNYNQTKNQNNNLMGSMQNMYGPNSPYAAQMRQSLERKDAASGRRSDYAGLESRLQANLADAYSRNMPTMAGLVGSNAANRDNAIGSFGQINKGLQPFGGLAGVAKSGWGAIQNMWNKSGSTPEASYSNEGNNYPAMTGNSGGDFGAAADPGTSYGIDDLSWLGD